MKKSQVNTPLIFLLFSLLVGKYQKLKGMYYLTSKKYVVPLDLFKETKSKKREVKVRLSGNLNENNINSAKFTTEESLDNNNM